MAFAQDDVYVSHQLVVGDKFPEKILKTGQEKVRGGASIEGPVVIGSPDTWTKQTATVMIGPDTNSDSDNPDVTLHVKGPLLFEGPVIVKPSDSDPIDVDDIFYINGSLKTQKYIKSDSFITADGDVSAFDGVHKLSNKKNFDIPHPTKPGWRLRHTCTEAPYNDVYIRGRLKNTHEIILPEYWKSFVDVNSITVNITPIGAHQNIIVRGITIEKIKLASNYGIPIDCFYQVFATRNDGDILIPEYEGTSPNDYPGNNKEYTINQ